MTLLYSPVPGGKWELLLIGLSKMVIIPFISFRLENYQFLNIPVDSRQHTR